MLKEILASLEGLTDLERAEVLWTLMSGQTVLQKVKTLLGITTEDQDDVLEYVIQTVQTLVLRYINWDELPLELENVLAVMCVSYYRTGNHRGGAWGRVFREARRRPDVLRGRFRFFRIGRHLQPGKRQRGLLRLEDGPE